MKKLLDKLPFLKLPLKRAVWDKDLGRYVEKPKEEKKDESNVD